MTRRRLYGGNESDDMPSGDLVILLILGLGPIAIILGLILLFLKRKNHHTSPVRILAILLIIFGVAITALLAWLISVFFSKPTGSFH